LEAIVVGLFRRHVSLGFVVLMVAIGLVGSVESTKHAAFATTASPTSLTFPDTPAGDVSSSQTVSVTETLGDIFNNGFAYLSDATNFTVTKSTCPGYSCAVDVAFTPQTTGSYTATLTIGFTGAITIQCGVPQNFNLPCGTFKSTASTVSLSGTSTTTDPTSTTSSTTTTVDRNTTTTATTVPPSGGPNDVDHFLCYTASLSTTAPVAGTIAVPNFALRPTAAEVENQFVPTGTYISVAGVHTHCNPVNKTTPDGHLTPAFNPAAHLLCWNIKTNKYGPVRQSRTLILTNQFGRGQVITGAALSLCLPSWKDDRNNPPQFPPDTQPPGLDHFVCYAATYPGVIATRGAPRFTPPSSVFLGDQFGQWAAVIGAPKQVCLPTQKSVDPNIRGDELLHPEAHLVCFGVTLAPPFSARSGVFDKNQFGIGQLNVSKASMLCVPSFKTVIP
jgi:hypothetical protein